MRQMAFVRGISIIENVLVNIVSGRGTQAMSRILLGDFLAGQVVELRGSPRLWPYR